MTTSGAIRLMQALNGARAGGARFVGGCVRNALLGQPVADVDVATQLLPDDVARVSKNAGMAVHPTGIEHGTLTVVADGSVFEVTTLRRDVETDGRRATVAFTEDWAEDARRRDFRINALYAAPDGEVFDPTGGGLIDIDQRRIMFVGEPETRIREDYLRILRFFRFNAWYGRRALNADGLAACARLRAGLAGISAERIWMEMHKLLAAPQPMQAVRAMAQARVMEQLFPDAHDLNVLERLVAIEAANGLSPDPLQRFMALFSKDADLLAGVARRMKMSNEERDRMVFAARDETPLDPAMPARDLRRALYLSGPRTLRDRAMLSWASRAGDDGDWPALLAVIDAYARPVMPVGGQDLVARGITPGPQIGQCLRAMEKAWIDSDFKLGHDELMRALR